MHSHPPHIGGGAIGRCEENEAGEDDEHVQQHSITPAHSVSQEAKEKLSYKDAHQLQVGGGLGPGLQVQSERCQSSCSMRVACGARLTGGLQAGNGRRRT